MASVTVEAPAKLNLTLDVLGKREDGYHEMKMVMQSVSLADTLTLEETPGEGIALFSNLSFLPTDGRNLAVVAAREFEKAAGCKMGHLEIRIQKRIPVCAGTAGGSSDAAAVLRGLNELIGRRFSLVQLAGIGRGVGSDVPYCVLGGTALAEGRGELITPLPQLPACWVVMAKPGFSISTPELFAQFDGKKTRCRPNTEGVLTALEGGDLGGVARRMFNVFEEVLPFRKRERVEELKCLLLDHGALGACMTGTGPTVFGLFSEEAAAWEAYQELKNHCRDTFLTQALGSQN